jgi:hypothetical protein
MLNTKIALPAVDADMATTACTWVPETAQSAVAGPNSMFAELLFEPLAAAGQSGGLMAWRT